MNGRRQAWSEMPMLRLPPFDKGGLRGIFISSEWGGSPKSRETIFFGWIPATNLRG
jgi:hypothetical protein